ncbi:alkaline phosphatase family protein [Streptacidiphilus sp. EB129]|uniref:alkaline phosphatase family protein n=1 Tax=Streptacidiphilus sp. EB129 TaxID=3156262 RepID=UPI0035151B83
MLAARARTLTTAALAAGGLLLASPAGSATALPGAATPSHTAATSGAAHYDHVFVVVEENHGYADLIGNPAAPNLNALAAEYGSATQYYAVSHPSEPNYVAMLGGSTFGVADDNAYYLNQVNAPSLISQLDGAQVDWKAYLQGLPHPGYQGICYPANCNGAPDKDPLYASKHNGVSNFTTSWNAADRARQVPVDQLGADLRSGRVPAFGYVVPSECDDQHGDPPYCVDSGNPGGSDPQDQRLVAQGDAYLGGLVAEITGVGFWAQGNNAIDIVYDEGDDNTGGGGQTADVVVTSHGPRGLQDPTPYSHYSLLRTLQDNFGVDCLQHSCDPATRPMSALLAVSGAAAQPFHALPVPGYPTPTPVPAEPLSRSTDSGSSDGWTVQSTPVLGSADNSFGAVAAVSPSDVWAVGNYLPDTSASNTDATLNLAAHFDGTQWTSTPIGDGGPNFDTLLGVAAVPGRAWAVGVAMDAGYRAHSQVEAWNGSAWHPQRLPGLGSQRDLLNAATAVSAQDVWAVGDQQGQDGVFRTLVEHYDGRAWCVVPSPNPGSSGDHLWGVAADGADDVWAVGQRNGPTGDQPLVEHFDGRAWSVVDVPSGGTEGALLQGVAVSGGQVWAVGQSDDAAHQARPLVEHLGGGQWTGTLPAGLGSGFSDVTGVAVANGTPWLVGSYFDAPSGNQKPILAHLGDGGWQQSAGPDPGVGDTVFGGIGGSAGALWAVGIDNSANGRVPLAEFHPAG